MAKPNIPPGQATPPQLFYSSGASVTEGQTLDFLLTLSAPFTKKTSVDYTIGPNPTITLTGPDADLAAPLTGTITFQPGQTEAHLRIPIVDDTKVDTPSEFFYINFTNPKNATLPIYTKAGITILDNDAAPANTAPDAQDDSLGTIPATLNGDGTYTVRIATSSLLANDTDPQNDPLGVNGAGGFFPDPTSASLVNNGGGLYPTEIELTYTLDTLGRPAQFNYTATDGALQDTANVFFTPDVVLL